MINPEKYYNPDRGSDLRKTGRHKTPRRNLALGEATRWSISEMWDVHHEAKRLILIGWKNVDIAKKLGLTPTTISGYRNSPIMQEELAIACKARDADAVDVAKEIKEFAPVALNLLKDIVEGEEDANIGLRAKVADSMLDKAGHGAVVKSLAIVGHLTKEEIDAMKEKAFGPSMKRVNPSRESLPEAT